MTIVGESIRDFATRKIAEADQVIRKVRVGLAKNILGYESRKVLNPEAARAELSLLSKEFPQLATGNPEHTLVTGLLDTEQKAQEQLVILKDRARPLIEHADSVRLTAAPYYENVDLNNLHTPFHNALNDFAQTIDSLVRLDTAGNRGVKEIAFDAKYPETEAAA